MRMKIMNIRNIIATGTVLTALLCTAFLAGAFADQKKEPDEREVLLKKREKLEKRVAGLKAEQDLLLFQKEMYAADSRYLILDMGKGRGQLKYKNRVLRGFPITVSSRRSSRPLSTGALTLSRKVDGRGYRHALIFGTVMVIQTRKSRVPIQTAHMTRVYLSQKDLNAIFYAVEEGAYVYVIK